MGRKISYNRTHLRLYAQEIADRLEAKIWALRVPAEQELPIADWDQLIANLRSASAYLDATLRLIRQ
jgi:hypothetical protein